MKVRREGKREERDEGEEEGEECEQVHTSTCRLRRDWSSASLLFSHPLHIYMCIAHARTPTNTQMHTHAHAHTPTTHKHTHTPQTHTHTHHKHKRTHTHTHTPHKHTHTNTHTHTHMCTVSLQDVKDISDPLKKVEAGLQAAGGDVPLQSVHIRAKLIDLAAKVGCCMMVL